MKNKGILGYAVPKKGIEDMIRGMNLNPNARYEIHNIIEKQGNLPRILELKTESGNILPYHAFPFDIEPTNLPNN